MISKGATYCEDCKGISWKQAKQKWEAIYKDLKYKRITCKDAQKKAGAIYNQVKNRPDDGNKNKALRSYKHIMDCK